LLTGVEKIHFDSTLIHKVPYFRRSELDENTFELSEYHKDFVVDVPNTFDILAQSQTCTIESLISKDMKYLSFQFHPEYSAEYIRSF
jgi:GMP synthase-like glutamine amidotransferase